MKYKNSDKAVSEIIGTLMLLLICISVMSIIYFYILSDDGPSPETFVKISGKVVGTNVILEHRGGEPLELDTKFNIIIAGIEYKGTVEDWLNDDNDDGEWNLGERMLFQFEYDLSHLGEYRNADVTAINVDSNSIVLHGPIELNPVSDAGLEITVDNPSPNVGEIVQISITVTSYGGDVEGSGNVSVRLLLPDGLTYVSSYSNSGHGSYNNETGLWSLGDVLVGSPATLKINATVVGIEHREFTQLALVLDGSGSIHASDWQVMIVGLDHAIRHSDNFPRDGYVEITIIQFGGGSPLAQVEIPPTIVTDDPSDPGYYQDIGTDILTLHQIRGWTPMGCGIRLATDQLHDVGNFSIDTKQVILLVTDGEPNCEWIPGGYTASYQGETKGKISAEEARTYLIDTLEMDENNDEFDCIAVLEGGNPDVDWMNSSMAWPEPSYFAPPFDSGNGWVTSVDIWQDFSDRINDIFELIFSSIVSSVVLADSTTLDLNDLNDQATIIITPQS